MKNVEAERKVAMHLSGEKFYHWNEAGCSPLQKENERQIYNLGRKQILLKARQASGIQQAVCQSLRIEPMHAQQSSAQAGSLPGAVP